MLLALKQTMWDTESDFLRSRLRAHSLSGSNVSNALEMVKGMGAMQGQDYEAVLWAIGLRCGGKARRSQVDDLFQKGKITRTWLLRGTLHVSASEDIRWMIEPTRSRLMGIAEKRDQHLGLSREAVEKAKTAMEDALRGGIFSQGRKCTG